MHQASPPAGRVAVVMGVKQVSRASWAFTTVLTYKKDLDSLLMALFFGAAMLCYASSTYLLLRPPRGQNGAPDSSAQTLGT